MANGDLNRVLFSGLDFDTYGDEQRARLQVQFAAVFNDFAVSSLGIMLLDLTAFGLSTLSFYLDRRATDTYLMTARTRKSVSRLTRQIGFKMGGGVASGVDLDITVDAIWPFDVPLPEGFQINGPNGLIFEIARDTLFTTPGEQGPGTKKAVPAFEGETIVENFVSDGTPAQVFDLRSVPTDKFVVEGTVTTIVDGATWDVVDFLEFGSTDQFEVGFSDEPPTVRFGDSVAGNIPTSGASIVVTYVASRGKEGQVTSSGTITDPVTPLVVAFTQIPLTITNPEGSVGGDDPLSVAAAKALAPKVWKSRRVAVVGEDYEALSGAYADPLFGRVAVAKAISSRSAVDDLTVQNLLQAILTASGTYDATVATQTALAITGLDQIALDTADIDTALANIVTQVGNITTATASAVASAQSSKNRVGEITVDASDIQSLADDGILAVAAIPTPGPDALTTATADALTEFFNRIKGEATPISSNAGLIRTSQDSIIADQATADLATVAIGLSTASGELLAIDTAKTSIDTQEAAVRAAVLVIQTDSTDLTATITTNKALIEAHFDRILSNDCKSNLVTVPILTRDAGGFYQAPSSGLLDSLQTYLDARKEVTQTVSVTSGVNFLIPAVLTARVGVASNFSESVVKTTVEAVIEGVLRDRAFGVALYESDLDDVVIDVDGVAFTNVRLLGHRAVDGTLLTTRLDADGNLIIGDSEVITRSSVSTDITVTTETAA